MKKLLILLPITLGLMACVPSENIKAVKDLGCLMVTPESRAEIRAGQKVKTNLCGDDLSK